jgi:uncharacterized protein (TIGR03663 family)
MMEPQWPTQEITEEVEERPVEFPPRARRRFFPRLGWEASLYLLLLLVAAGLRLWDLGSRAMHHDESLHTYFSWLLATGKGYQHEPMMHGPFQFHINALVFNLLWDGDYTSRLAYALFGTALVGLPFFLRGYLGKAGALVTAALLAFSPTLLYFSRFARNDIYMAFWSLALVICLWRYIQERRNRYLYIGSAVLAFAFATKETAFILTAAMGGILFLYGLPSLFLWFIGRRKLSQLSGAAALFFLLLSLTLPQWSALASLPQDRLGIILANPAENWRDGPVGFPMGNGLYVAFGVVVFLFGLSIYTGVSWNAGVWLICALVFYAIWATLYSTFYTNIAGLFTGVWQSMGYWLAQQDVARGGQPWYYYLVLGFNYEFLPFLFSLAAIPYYLWAFLRRALEGWRWVEAPVEEVVVPGDAPRLRWWERLRERAQQAIAASRGEQFSLFLVLWVALTFAAYTVAGEKMPWLMVNVTLPFVLLAGRFIGDLVERVPWRWVIRRGHIALLLLVPLLLAVGVRVFQLYLERGGVLTMASWSLSLLIILVVLLATVAYIGYRSGPRLGVTLGALSLALVFLGFSIFVAGRAAYRNGDVPVEMLVYTQTAPDVVRVRDSIVRLAEETGKGRKIKVLIDQTDGFAWPWVWYFRNYKGAVYPCYSTTDPGCSPLREKPQADVVLINARNSYPSERYLRDFAPGRKYRHRWWFPESYRELPSKIKGSIGRRDAWRRVLDYFIYRRLGTPLGSIDAYAYFPKDFTPLPLGPEP